MKTIDEEFAQKIQSLVNDYPACIADYINQPGFNTSVPWFIDPEYYVFTDILEIEAANAAAAENISEEYFFERFRHYLKISLAVVEESGLQPKPVVNKVKRNYLSSFVRLLKRKSG